MMPHPEEGQGPVSKDGIDRIPLAKPIASDMSGRPNI